MAGIEVRLAERLDHVRHGTCLAGTIDQLALTERCEHHHWRDPVASDLLGRADPVELGHLDVHHHQIRPEIGGQGYRHFSVASLADHVIALLGEHLHQIQPDQHLVLGDNDPRLGSIRERAVFSSHGDTLVRCL